MERPKEIAELKKLRKELIDNYIFTYRKPSQYIYNLFSYDEKIIELQSKHIDHLESKDTSSEESTDVQGEKKNPKNDWDVVYTINDDLRD